MGLRRILLLASLAAAVTLGPKAMARLAPGASSSGPIAQFAALSRQAQASGVQVGGGGAVKAVPYDVQRMLEQAAADPQSFSEEERQLLAGLKDMSDSSTLSAPVLESLRQTQQHHAEKAAGWTDSIRAS
ncbi:MAG: hypothetical protein WC943_16960, partial [Elusimicrobiota bacterium]